MARSQSYLAKCDRHGCKTVIEIASDTIAPEGWIQVRVEIDKKWDARAVFEFCGEKCLSIWAKSRNTHPGSHESNGNGFPSSMPVRDSIREAIEILAQEKEAGEFKSLDVQSLSGIPQSTVDRHLNLLVEDGTIHVVNSGSGKSSNPRMYARG
jgi:hypothetical protein